MSMINCSLLSLGCAFGFTPPGEQNTLTALRALKIAQRRLKPQVRSKLLSVASSRSDSTLHPEAWRFVFSDPGTSGNCRIVTVAAKTSSEHPDTVQAFNATKSESVSGAQVIPQNKLLIDSRKVLELVRTQSKLKGVKSAEYRLTQAKNKPEPTWVVQFFGEKSEPVVLFQISAKGGAVVCGNGAEK